jgi:hypothetical protein
MPVNVTLIIYTMIVIRTMVIIVKNTFLGVIDHAQWARMTGTVVHAT